MRRIAALVVAALLLPATQVRADTTISFTSLILPRCVLTLGSPGVMGSSEDGERMATNLPGGDTGSALVLAVGGSYKFEVDAPSGFALAPSGGQPDTIETTYSASGVTVALNVDAAQPLNLGLGLTNIDLEMTAEKTNGVFPPGSYRSDLVVRCVPQ